MVNTKKLFKYKKLLNLYPPFLSAGIRIKEFSKEGNSYLVLCQVVTEELDLSGF